jgi:DNA replication protein DnaD
MKLYIQPEPPTLMRINIKKLGAKSEHIAVLETSQQEVLDWLKVLIEKQRLSIFLKGKVTTVEVRESIKGINGKVISFSFKGMEPSHVKELILKNIKS